MKATIFDGKDQRPYTSTDAQVLSTNTPYAWIDIVIDEPNDPEVRKVLEQMGFTDVVAAYTTRTYSSGMFQAFGDNMLGSTYASADPDAATGPVLIHCVWNSGCIITIRKGADEAIATALRELRPRAEALFAKPGPVPGILMHLILDSINRQLTDLQTEIALLDGQIIVTSNPKQLTALQQLRKPIEDLGTTVPSYAENVAESLVDPTSLPGIDAPGAQALQTYAASVNDIVQRIDGAGSDIRSAIQDYQGQVSTTQGNRINQLTIVSIIFLPITFLTGYFGMNFQYLVNITQSLWTWIVMGILLPLIMLFGSIVLLRRKGYAVSDPLRFHLRHHRHPADAQAPPVPNTPA